MRATALLLGVLACGAPRDEPAPAARERFTCEADVELVGLAANDHLAFSLASLGPDGRADWNGDGALDLLAGSYQKLDVPAPSETTGGSATLFLGPWTSAVRRPTPKDRAMLRVEAEPGARFGHAVAWLGDLDEDGRSDFAAGEIRGPALEAGGWSQRGRLFVFLSGDRECGLVARDASGRSRAEQASAIVVGDVAGGRFGHAVAGAGDWDGDGTPDVLVGAPGSFATPGYAGRALVLSGARIVAARRAREAGEAPEPLAASALALWSRDGDAPLDGFGYQVARVAPGRIAAGAPEVTFDPSIGLAPERSMATNGPGYVVLASAQDERRLAGEAEGDLHGFALGAADLDGDGSPECLVGAPGWSGAAERAGRALAYAADGSIRAELRGSARFEMEGWCVGGHGPAPGGGELWASGSFGYARAATPEPGPCADAPHDRPVPQAGRLRVLDARGATLFTVVGERNADSAGASFAHAGDLDASGGTDVVVASFRWDEPPPRNDVGKVCIFCDPLE